MRKIVLILMSLLIIYSLLAVNPPRPEVKDMSEDAMDEMETGQMNIYFYNALNGQPIAKAQVTFEDIGTFITDNEGKVSFEPTEDNYFQKLVFKSPDYITSEFEVEVMAGTLFFNRFSISPVMAINQFRVILDWSKKPRDLDANFRKEGSYTISYRGMKTLHDGSGRLDRDDRDGYGPETITIDKIETNAIYEYFVEDYDNRQDRESKALSKSKAHVKVYGNGRLLNTFEIPKKVRGNQWQVFRIENGQVIPESSVN